MKTTTIRTLSALAAALALSTSAAALAAKPAPAKPAKVEKQKPPAKPQPSEQTVAYEELEKHTGAEVVVHTAFNTVRKGTLVKYTIAGLTLKLHDEDGGFELSVPRDTVRSVGIVVMPAEAPTPPPTPTPTSNTGAKKN